MNQLAHDKVRKTIDLDTGLVSEIEELAKKKMWSFSKMAYVLLQQAVNETRRKRSAKKIPTEHYSADSR